MLSEEEYAKEQVAQDLRFMYKAGLIDIKMREDGEWVYFATDYAKSLKEDQLNAILESMAIDYDEFN